MARRGTGTIDRLELEPTLFFEQTLRKIEHARRKRAKRRRLLIVASIVLVPILAAGTFVLTQRAVTTEVSLNEATKTFRAQRGQRAETSDATSSGLQRQTTAGARVNDIAPTEATDTAPETKVAAPAQAGPYELPAEGVYVYRASGGEQISILGANHKYPERVYATVRHLGGCNWEHRNDVIKEHVDRRQWCSKAGLLTQLMQAREVEFFGQRDGDVAKCSPPMVLHKVGESSGATYEGTCSGEGTTSKVKRTVVDTKPFVIGGESIDAVHLHIVGTFKGMATGTSIEDVWIDASTGMTLRWDRNVDTNANSAFGNVHYTEQASFVLASLVPQT